MNIGSPLRSLLSQYFWIIVIGVLGIAVVCSIQIITLVISREEEAITAATSFSEAGRNRDYATMAKYLLGRDNKPLTPEETERNFQGVMGSFKY